VNTHDAAADRPAFPAGTGLCATCEHAQLVTSSRGSHFVLCRRSAIDPAFQKYPRLPMLRCSGYDARQS
jgi:hypothetical protein